MAEPIIVIGKACIVAFIAAIAAWLPMAVLNGMDGGLTFTLFPIALLGSFAVGLPTALLCFFLAGAQLRKSPGTAFLMANLASAMLLLASFAIADAVGLIFLGLPSVIAANTFAVLGWFWIVKPSREKLNV